MKLILSKKQYENLSPQGLAVYCALKQLMVSYENHKVCGTVKTLVYTLCQTMKCSRRMIEYIIEALDELEKKDLIKVIETSGKTYVWDCSKLHVDIENEFFNTVTSEEVNKIFQIKGVDSFLLLRYFVCVMSTISTTIEVKVDVNYSKSNCVGNMTINYIARICGIRDSTAMEYNKLLEENGLIYIYRQPIYMINRKSKALSRLPNVYGRPCDKIFIDTFAKNERDFKKGKDWYDTRNKQLDERRKLAQRYNQLCMGNDKNYNEEDIIAIFTYVVEENKRYEELSEKKNNSDFLEKLRDLSVFDKYDFIQMENN